MAMIRLNVTDTEEQLKVSMVEFLNLFSVTSVNAICLCLGSSFQ